MSRPCFVSPYPFFFTCPHVPDVYGSYWKLIKGISRKELYQTMPLKEIRALKLSLHIGRLQKRDS